MAEAPGKVEIHRGLQGVHFDRSRVCFIDGRAGELLYRGYSIHDLATQSTFEETCYLLLYGELPTRAQLASCDAELKAARTLPAGIVDIIRTVRDAHPMDVLRTAVSALAAFDSEVNDLSAAATARKGLRITAQVPMIIAAHEAVRHGREPVPPDPELGHAANFLYMVTGRSPSATAARLMDVDMILHAEHGSNASAFTARVVAGTKANLHAAITAAIAALSGPSHGGAAENVIRMAQEIGDASKAADYVKAKRGNKEAVMGFGHRVYRAEDPARNAGGVSAARDGRSAGTDPGGAGRGDEALRAPRRERQRRLLRRRRLFPERHRRGSVRARVRRGARSGLDRAGAGAAREQHPDPAADAVRRTCAARLRSDRRALTRLNATERAARAGVSVTVARIRFLPSTTTNGERIMSVDNCERLRMERRVGSAVGGHAARDRPHRRSVWRRGDRGCSAAAWRAGHRHRLRVRRYVDRDRA
jgi:citrate synthase